MLRGAPVTGAGGGLRAPCHAGAGREAEALPGHAQEGSVWGTPSPPCPQGAPQEAAGPRRPTQRRKGPGGSLYAPPWGCVLLLGLAQAGRSLRRFSSAPGASPRDAPRASCPPRPGVGCLRLRRLKPSARFSPSARVRCFLGLSVQSEAAGEARHGLPRSARAGSADAELGTGRSSGLGPEAAVTAPRDAGVGPGGGRQPLRGHCPRPPGRSGLTPLPPHARHTPRHRRGRCSFSLPCETSRCRRARRPQAQGSRD